VSKGAVLTDTDAKLESLGGGRFRISGVLDATTVSDLLKQSTASFEGHAHVDVDLKAVSESDSSGLALLIEWLRLARMAKRQIHFENVPPQIEALARISEVEDLLSNSRADPSQHPAAVASAAS
jgi:phospholipid transport system transporter-binding protein